jgi:tripartite ATP-independent transporter DctM subunit
MMSLLAIGLFLLLSLFGLPIAMSMGLASGAVIWWYDMPLAVVAQRTINSLDSTPLLAVPMFIFAAAVFNATGITAQLFDFIRMLVGRIRGGLGHVTVLTHLVFSGISGAALADIGALGKIQIDMMRKQGYDDEFSAGICMAAATLGPIFPPSIPLVIFAMAAEISPVKILLAGIIPSLIIALFLMIQIAFIARRRNLPRDTIEVTAALLMRQFWVTLPALLAPVILIGGMVGGYFGSTEAAAVTVVYAIVAGIAFYRKLTWHDFVAAGRETVLTSASVLLIVGCAALFAWVLTVDRLPTRAAEFLLSLSRDPQVLLLIVNVLLLLVGMIMESLAAILIVAPIITPALVAAGVDPVHLGIVVVLNLMIGLLTPPVGMSLFMVANVARMPLDRVLAGGWPFIVCLMLSLLTVTYLPIASTWLPNLLMK